MTLEEIVNKLNEGIKDFDGWIISEAIDELLKGEYIDETEARYLHQDIMNDGCTFLVSSFERSDGE